MDTSLARPVALALVAFLALPAAALAQTEDRATPQRAMSGDEPVPTPPTPPAAPPPDVVRLRDGSFLRGTLVERSPDRVVLLLPTGETRVYAPADVESAGPSDVVLAPPPAVPPPPAPAPLMAPLAPSRPRVRVTSEQPNLALSRLAGTASVVVWTGRGAGHAQIDAFDIVCTAPCETELEPGTYQLGIANGGSAAIRAGDPITVNGPMDLHLSYDDRSMLRVAGWITLVGGAALGAGLITGAVLDDSYGYDVSITDHPMFIGGLVVTIVAMAVGFPLTWLNDAAEIEVRF